MSQGNLSVQAYLGTGCVSDSRASRLPVEIAVAPRMTAVGRSSAHPLHCFITIPQKKRKRSTNLRCPITQTLSTLEFANLEFTTPEFGCVSLLLPPATFTWAEHALRFLTGFSPAASAAP